MGEIFDRAGALVRAGGDEAFLQELLELYLGECSKLVAQIETAIAGGDAKGIERAAHTLKGSSGNMGATSVQAAALELETAGREGSLGEGGPLLDKVKAELGRFEAAVDESS